MTINKADTTMNRPATTYPSISDGYGKILSPYGKGSQTMRVNMPARFHASLSLTILRANRPTDRVMKESPELAKARFSTDMPTTIKAAPPTRDTRPRRKVRWSLLATGGSGMFLIARTMFSSDILLVVR